MLELDLFFRSLGIKFIWTPEQVSNCVVLTATRSEMHFINAFYEVIHRCYITNSVFRKYDFSSGVFLMMIPQLEKLSDAKTRFDLAQLLDVSERGLRGLLYGESHVSNYHAANIPKKNGGTRILHIPIPQLKNLQLRLASLIQNEYRPRRNVQGFVKNKGIKTNAEKHVRRNIVVNVDLKDFFPSINFGRVRGLFMAEPFNLPSKVATDIARICCVQNQLPQGAPTSPVVSNLICRSLDSHLSKLARSSGWRYTRYADDITFSAMDNTSSLAARKGKKLELSQKVLRIIEQNGFVINESKLRAQNRNTSQMVTGLVTNEKVNVPRNFIRNVRAMLHKADIHGLQTCEEEFINRYKRGSQGSFFGLLRGRINFIGHIRGYDDVIYLRMLKSFLSLPELATAPSKLSAIEEKLSELQNWREAQLDRLWVVETELSTSTGVALSSGGILTCAHSVDGSCIEVLKRDGSRRRSVEVTKKSKEFDLAIIGGDQIFKGAILIQETLSIPVTGDRIITAGFPHYSDVNRGVVEEGAITGTKASVDGHERWILSTPIRYGHSGGPLFNQNHDFIGIAAKGNEGIDRSEGSSQPEGIPLATIVEFLQDIEGS